uniref:ATP synthase subunit g n=1 Tax=Petromyzon marinus TaxID=7757 RepID=A0AAJ7SL73_PETMA|nr:ATP synthase subunit g, mitochondrial-like [Petromyzon marinus]XP_032801387.1 ATP synthase subunit g, mitochondrial-like [Petromyzon marinus]
MAAAAQRVAGIVAKKTPQLVAAAVEFSRPRLSKFWSLAKVELVPPSPAEIPRAVEAFKAMVERSRRGGVGNLTVREALRNSLVGVEIAMWFYVGEVIGRRSLIGYNV